jgi:hypothetical protein
MTQLNPQMRLDKPPIRRMERSAHSCSERGLSEMA